MTMNISFKRDCISFCISQTMCVQPEGKTHYKATLIAWMCVLKLPCCEKSNPNKPGSWWSLCTLLRGAQVTLLAGQGGVACDTHCTQGEKIPRKSENWVPQITAWLSLRGLCWFCALTAGGGTSGEFVCYPRAWKKPEKEINPSSPCPCSLGTGSGTDWDPLWLLPSCHCSWTSVCLSCLCPCCWLCPGASPAVWGQPELHSSAQLRNTTLPALGCKALFQAAGVRQNHLALE